MAYFTVFSVLQPESSIIPSGAVLDTGYGDGFTLLVNAAGTEWLFTMGGNFGSPSVIQGGTPTVGVPTLLTGICNNGAATLQVNTATPEPSAALSGTTLLNANRYFGAEYGITVP
jgi:hypothetical protein